MFGSYFNDIVVRRTNIEKKLVTNVTVPIRFSPKRKWVIALENGELNKGVAIQLPAMAFDFTGYSYDTTRKINPYNKILEQSKLNGYMYSGFQSVPYKINAELYITAKNNDDAAQIVEQIIPYFQPDFTCSLKLLDELEHTFDIRTRLIGVQRDEIYDGTFEKKQLVMYTLNFEIDGYFFGPISKSGVIKRVIVDFHLDPVSDGVIDTTVPATQRYAVQPGLTPDGKPTGNITQSIPYEDINYDDPYGYVESFSENIFGMTNTSYFDSSDNYQTGIEIVNGNLTVQGNYATTFFITQDQNISNINIIDWNSEELTFYIKQNEEGGWSISGLPEGTMWPIGSPDFTNAPNGMNKLTITSPDKGATVYANLMVY
jgi:hypothetical protein